MAKINCDNVYSYALTRVLSISFQLRIYGVGGRCPFGMKRKFFFVFTVKFGQLIFSKLVKIVATRYHILRQKCKILNTALQVSRSNFKPLHTIIVGLHCCCKFSGIVLVSWAGLSFSSGRPQW